jgi:protein TonB
MTRRNAARTLVTILLLSGSAVPACPARAAGTSSTCRPPGYVERAVREANRIQLVRLGAPDDREPDPLARDADRGAFVGFHRVELVGLDRDGVRGVSRMLDSGNLACMSVPGVKGAEYVVGFDLSGPGGAVRARLRMPSGAVIFEIPNGRRFEASLSAAGMRLWQRCVAAIAARAGRSPAEFERDLAGDAQPGEPPAPPAGNSVFVPVPPAFHPVVPEIPAEPITKVAPVYPDIAREADVQGTVVVKALVGADGAVHVVGIVKSIPMLDAAARAAMMQWRFEPARAGGKPVDAWYEGPIRFSLH